MKFYETIDKYRDKNIDIYVDMDGVIAEYDIGNFDYDTIRPLKSNIKRIEELINNNNININILTICKNDKIVNEKIKWIEKYMPFFDVNSVIFISKEKEENKGVSSKELKSEFLKLNINDDNINIVVDDDNEIIKYLGKNNANIIIFQVSSWID